jgi:arginine:ornithine antiporter/lysine permease
MTERVTAAVRAGAPRSATAAPTVTFGVGTMTAMVVGAVVGSGVFSLPGLFARATGVTGALIAWSAAALGMFMLVLAFRALAVRRPALDSGIYAYAKAGFGEYAGFISTLGYWAANCSSNVVYLVLILSTLGAWFPALGAGESPLTGILASGAVWGVFLLVRRGIRQAAIINRVVTVAKLLPIVAFVVLAVVAFRPEVFAENLSGDLFGAPLFEQVRNAMFATVFVFGGIECASVFSRHARRRRDVGRATVLGFASVLAVFASVTIVSYGVLPADKIAALPEPSMAGVLGAAVGPWGTVLVSVGLIVTLMGTYLSCTLIAAEIMFVAASDRDMPKLLAGQNTRGVPTAALFTSAAMTQAFLVVTWFSNDAFTLALEATSAFLLISWLLAAAYQLKIAAVGDGYGAVPRSQRRRELLIGLGATAYVLFLLFAAGVQLVLLAFLVYVPATVVFAVARRQQGRRVFSGREPVVFAGALAAAATGVLGLIQGWIVV